MRLCEAVGRAEVVEAEVVEAEAVEAEAVEAEAVDAVSGGQNVGACVGGGDGGGAPSLEHEHPALVTPEPGLFKSCWIIVLDDQARPARRGLGGSWRRRARSLCGQPESG